VPSRRHFLGTAAALVVGLRAPALRAVPPAATAPGDGPSRLAFSTLGCPTWEWTRVLDFAADHGYGAIELRGLAGTMDLTRRPEFAPAAIADTRRQLAERRLRVIDLGSSAMLHETDAARYAAHLDEARRFVDLAAALGAPYVRVFGNKYVAGVPREATVARIAAGLRELGTYAQPKGVTVLLESHGDFTDSPTLLAIMRQADSPAVALLWDAHHTFVLGREQPEDTVRQLGLYIRHTHLKDSVPGGKDRRYVLTGQGDVPVRRQIGALARGGYRGYYSFEWEKLWQPDLAEPEVALAQFATVAREYLRGAPGPSTPKSRR